MKDKIKGGKADKLSIEDIARKHCVFLGTIQKELEMGVKIEMEHTNDKALAKEIAMDHLEEFPDYYTRLDKMEKTAKKETKKCVETKESMGADASGSFEGPAFGTTILKKDIHTLHNSKSQKITEVADSGISAGAMYDAPLNKDPMKIENPNGSTGTIVGNKKTDKKSIAVAKKGFPKFGGPDAKFVSIDAKQTFPYSDQGDPKNSSLYEIEEMKDAVQEAAKKYGLSVKQVQKIISEALPMGMLDDPGNARAMKSWTDKGEKDKFHITTIEPISIRTDDDVDVAKLKILFSRYDVPFEIHKIKQ